jgi:tRNA A-37 threonylcarbamoyl transferase component Bud32
MSDDPRPDEPREGGADDLRGLDPQRLMEGALKGGEDPGAAEEDARLRAEIARRLPDLEVLELLGRGGMGTVYKVRQRKLARVVALKVLTPREDLALELAERFEREARTLAQLTHPNIVAIFDFGREDGFCWLLMEYVDGTTLRQLLDRGDLEPRQALALVGPLCDALQYAHEKGIVHRDVKPENVLIDRQGRPKVADFGLAKLLGEPAALVSLTASRQVLGTLRYMAPEQLDRPLEVDHRADLYALGVVLYEMLTGEVPVGRFELPSERVHTPPRLDEVVLRSLEREPARRYQSASAVKSDVEEVDRSMEGAAAVGAAAASRPAGSRAASTGSPELATGAWLAPLLIVLAPVLLVLLTFAARTLHYSQSELTWAMDHDVAMPAYVGPTQSWSLWLPKLLGVAATLLLLGAACVVGWMALSRLKRDWPARYGVAGAAIGAWFLPYFLVWSPLLVIWSVWTDHSARYGFAGVEVAPPAGVNIGVLLVGLVFLALGPGGFTLLVALYRARFLRKVRASA